MLFSINAEDGSPVKMHCVPHHQIRLPRMIPFVM